MKSHHFDLGNSSKGPIGFCRRVAAESKKRALEILKEALPESFNISHDRTDENGEGVEYIEVYLNDEAITTKDIDSVDPKEQKT